MAYKTAKFLLKLPVYNCTLSFFEGIVELEMISRILLIALLPFISVFVTGCTLSSPPNSSSSDSDMPYYSTETFTDDAGNKVEVKVLNDDREYDPDPGGFH
ncbi:MAG: hypothetical protein UU64_C0002G0105 [candidate division WWE3 bacterium GW2011_GWF2_41_45]|uniref:Uncharacterized protein n=2 Tax=Katanobacteria TaxID=422282 RepID=A0A1F4W2Z9_UNCKA|nr:MAG: hypothetical protein UU55_C0001G0013 [candidate division WWE3 bacterium GW2011_GWC2_41_23]KKS10703.1 MAG: hypothetical protein UU64_C0002G0105 [candidate division WWE3 bacterium GW2011_GWF2_41_45]KKS12286.1 MAG: hypothetical protein UU68_C0002G0012 [candidate division WWE3 bacterium GW2011_GWF1_41_53]KKS20359.1 MAG: hypothetical protein UU79_C0001G0013 [candidate division WWE3 bacterium GW2011_GWE1_41_72]KKS28183.1 MAG: hypothetical protein UU86_C0009G0013 [candidate division WWE3 bacte